MNGLQSAVQKWLCCRKSKCFLSHFQQSQGIWLLNLQTPLEIKLSSETSGSQVSEHLGGNSLGSKHFGSRYIHKPLWEALHCEHQVSQFENVSLAPSLVCINILQELKKIGEKKEV